MRNPRPYPLETLFKGLRPLLDSLPTEEEKQNLLQTLDDSKLFLEELHNLVEAIPTMESSRELSEGLSRLYSLTDVAAQDTGLRKLLGLRNPDARSGGTTEQSVDTKTRVTELESLIAGSSISAITPLLNGESLTMVKKLAVQLGLVTRSKERKSDLIKRMVNHIENQRGYMLLRGGDASSKATAITLDQVENR